tara:strand:- start:1300 stop:2433 length:1134 start_codon:yes stop_codon:yes gene_type:complete
MKYELYINNHKYHKGIEDYIYSIKNIFSRNNFHINVVNKISDDVDVLLVIENFISIPKELLEFFEKPKLKKVELCLIHSEFVDQKLFFNLFDSREIIFRNCLYVGLLSYLYQNDKFYIKKFLFYIIIFFYLLLGLIIGFNPVDIKRRISFALRDYNLSKYLKFFSYNLALSDDVYECLRNNPRIKNAFYLQNYYDFTLINKFKERELNNNLLYITGSKTPFRKKVIYSQRKIKFNNFIINDKLNISKYNFSKTKELDFNLLLTDETEIKKLIKVYSKKFNIKINQFELYIAQRKNWPYLSAMRISRAFRNYSIPINVGTFVKSNYENLCINVKSIDDFIENYNYLIEDYLKNYESKIKSFNNMSSKFFNFFIENIKN